MYSVHTKRFNSFEVTSMRGSGSGHTIPELATNWPSSVGLPPQAASSVLNNIKAATSLHKAVSLILTSFWLVNSLLTRRSGCARNSHAKIVYSADVEQRRRSPAL